MTDKVAILLNVMGEKLLICVPAVALLVVVSGDLSVQNHVNLSFSCTQTYEWPIWQQRFSTNAL